MSEPYFVYVADGLHRWRFVWHGLARDGDDAITLAQTQAIDNEMTPNDSYMAAPAWALTTRGEPRETRGRADGQPVGEKP